MDSLQRDDEADYDGLLDLFPQNYHEPYYRSYTNEDFGTLAAGCGLTHIRDLTAFVSNVMVFDKPAVGVREKSRPLPRAAYTGPSSSVSPHR